MLFASIIALSACLDDALLGQSVDYTIQGVSDDSDVKEYLDTIITDRTVEAIAYDAGTASFERAETAREQSIEADLLKALKAKGFYDARVQFEDNQSQALTGIYTIDTGEIFTISDVTIEPENMAQYFNNDSVSANQPLKALPILNAQAKLYENVQKDKCYFSINVDHEVILNKNTKTAALKYIVDVGAPATFGKTTFQGQESVKDSYLKNLMPWKEGACFRREKIISLRNALLQTGLFVRADSTLPEAPDENGNVDITITLKERAHRSVKAGVSYYTDEGAGIVLGWEHRNLRGGGEKLNAELNMSQINQSLDADFSQPYFLRKDQSLELSTALRMQDTDAFEETALDLGASIKRQFTKTLSGNTGVNLTFSEITDEESTDTFGLVSFPNSILFDNRDDPLDPHKGWQLKASIEPFYDVLGQSDPFTKFEAGGRTYIDLSDKPDIVLAVRANAGSIVGGSVDDIPATERFYAGGGGSIRGFGYQEVGPFNDGDPSGGRSLVTSAAEFRWKFTKTLGAVAFVDAGSVSESVSPDMSDLSIGAGLGMRYYTDFGPLRFDVAIPINQRENLDQNYQFYISIGQAF